jgi:DNA repair protein RecO (recombination protein O)
VNRQTLSGIVLGHTDIGESDRLVHLLTRERGLVTARARGARKSRKRYGGRLDRYSLVRVQLSGQASRASLGDVDLIQPFLGIREDLTRTAVADLMLELVRLQAHEEESAPQLFGLTVRVLGLLDGEQVPTMAWVVTLVLHVLREAGLGLELRACATCGHVPSTGQAALSASAGGLLCEVHAHEDPAARRLTAAELTLLRRAGAADLAETPVTGAPATAAAALRQVIQFAEYHLERKLRTVSFLEPLLAEDSPPHRRGC